MCKRISQLFVFLLLFAVNLPLPALSDQHIYATDSREFELVNLLVIQSGGKPVSDAGPWSRAEVLQMFQQIDEASLSHDMKSLYEDLKQELSITEEVRTPISVGADLSVEMYAHTNTSTYFDEDEEWFYDYTSRNSLLEPFLALELSEHIYAKLQYGLRNNRFHFVTEDTAGFFGKEFSTNLIFDDRMENLNVTNPWVAYISIGGSNWNLQFGRDKQSWGSGFLGNLMINDHVDFHEYVTFSAFNEHFKFMTTGMIFDHPSTYADDESSPSSFDPITGFSMFIAHRLELPLGNMFRISISEGMMIQSAEEPLSSMKLSWFNPMMFYHNYYMAGTSNSIASLSATALIKPGLNIYGEFVLDELSAITESNKKPNAFGYLAGVLITSPISTKHILSLRIESGLTDPFLYLRGDTIDYLVGQRQPVSARFIPADEDFLGFPYGPDVFIIGLRAKIHSVSSWQGHGSLIYMQKGCIDQETDYQESDEAVNLTTPSSSDLGSGDKNAIEHRLISSFEGTFPINELLDTMLHTDWIHRWNPENRDDNPYTSDIQVTFNVTLHL